MKITIRNGSITIIRRHGDGTTFRSDRSAVRIFGNDGTNSFDVRASSVRRCRALAKRQGIRFPRPVRPEPKYVTLSAPGYHTTRVRAEKAANNKEVLAWANGRDWRQISGHVPEGIARIRGEWDKTYR